MTAQLVWRGRRSMGQARDLVRSMVRCGNNFDIPMGSLSWTNAEVEHALRTMRGIDFEPAASAARDPDHVLPFENLVGSMWTASAGVKISAFNHTTGVAESEVEGPAVLALEAYRTIFESAIAARDRVVEQNTPQGLGELLTAGVAAVEGYLRRRASTWNDMGGQPPLIDNSGNRLSFDDKLREWLPVTAGGQRVDLGNKDWQKFRGLRVLRDDVVVHGKSTSIGWTYREIAGVLNDFRHLAKVLLDLHVIHGEKCPAIIIKAAYAPHVEIASQA